MHSLIYHGQIDGFIRLLSTERSATSASLGKAGVWWGGVLTLISFCHHSLGCYLLHRVIKLSSASGLCWEGWAFLQKSPVKMHQSFPKGSTELCGTSRNGWLNVVAAVEGLLAGTEGTLQPLHVKNNVTLAAGDILASFQLWQPSWVPCMALRVPSGSRHRGFAGVCGCFGIAKFEFCCSLNKFPFKFFMMALWKDIWRKTCCMASRLLT